MTRWIALLLLILPCVGWDRCRVSSAKRAERSVLVPVNFNGHTNLLVQVPAAVAFSQVAVPVGIPVASYGAVSYGYQAHYAPQAAGFGLMPQYQPQVAQAHCPPDCSCRQHGVTAQAVDPVVELLKTRCVSCHSSAEHKGGLRMFGDDGSLLKLPRHSMLSRMTSEEPDKRMPKGSGPLSPEEIELLRAWAEEPLPKEVAW